jgi:hypothetical protein
MPISYDLSVRLTSKRRERMWGLCMASRRHRGAGLLHKAVCPRQSLTI